jgi:hypothetical protein
MSSKSKITGLAAMVTQMSENGCGDAEILAMFAAKGQGRGRPTTTDKCAYCGGPHRGECWVKMYAEGKTIPGWADKPKKQQEAIIKKAEEFKAKKSDGPNVMLATPKALAAAPTKMVTMHVDSQAGANFPYHFIADPRLFIAKHK